MSVKQPDMSDEVDPITFQVVKNSLISAAEEMKIVLAKTAYSPLLKLAGDYSCGIFDVYGNMVAQGPDIPIHLGSMPPTVRAILSTAGEVAPGDVFIHNDPYFGGLSPARRETWSLPFSWTRRSCWDTPASEPTGRTSAVPVLEATAPPQRYTGRGCACPE